MTREQFDRWVELTYSPDRHHYGGWELMWKDPELHLRVTTAMLELQELNRLMIKEYPFLLPRNRWTDQVVDGFDYSYNEWEAIDYGWQISFGYDFLVDLAKALKENNELEDFRIEQIKEKFGELRFYCGYRSEKVGYVVDHYCDLSTTVCIHCGKPATCVTRGWITYICDDCAKDLEEGKDYTRI